MTTPSGKAAVAADSPRRSTDKGGGVSPGNGRRKTADKTGAGDRRRSRRVRSDMSVAVEISYDTVSWVPGVILNHSAEGAMIETDVQRKPGSPVKLRYPATPAALTATGNVAHVLLGDEKKCVGVGIGFYGDRNWPKILAYLDNQEPSAPDAGTHCPDGQTTGAPAAADKKAKAQNVPVDLTRDGLLWMAGRIVDIQGNSVRIKTPILGKPGETLRIRFKLPEAPSVVNGTIVSVDLDDMAPLAGMALDFAACDQWSSVLAGLGLPVPAETAGDLPPGKDRTPVRQTAPAAGTPATPQKEPWVETVLIPKAAPKQPLSTSTRFYRSLIGKKLDNYEVVSFISSGAMGGVFKGWDVALERDVALKVISFELSSQDEFVQMFFREARFVSKLNHQNIAQIYYIGNSDDILYYAMEFIHGQTLADALKDSHRLDPVRAAEYMRTVCRALDFVRKKQIIHRDIKPANIMITDEDVVKIVDFGVAQHHSKCTDDANKTIVGSPNYLSPESIRGRDVDFRSDIYSLGATFYHLIAGKPPYTDSSINGILQKHLRAPLPPLESAAPETPQVLCQVIEKMLAKRADERFQDYGEITGILASVTGPF